MAKKNKIPRAAEAEAEAAAYPPWIELPLDVTANILGRLDILEKLMVAPVVCSTWLKACQGPAVWRVIKIVYREYKYAGKSYYMMCRRAVDRSNGQLTDLTLDEFCNDELLAYISDRSSRLRRLTLSSCCISRDCLSKAVKKLPELEELHLFSIIDVREASDDHDLDADVEAIGIACPKLKSFTFNRRQSKHEPPGYGYTYTDDDDDDDVYVPLANNEHAVAIGKFMPNLCHLSLFANDMDNDGVQAILDGCLLLESLDLRQSFGVDLGGALGVRCRQQIKDVRAPSDSVDDYQYYFDPYMETESEYETGSDDSVDDDDDDDDDDDESGYCYGPYGDSRLAYDSVDLSLKL